MRTLGPNAKIPDNARGAAVALGNFDGVHLGHQAVIASARGIAQARGLALGAAAFEPHTRRYFQPDAPPFRLQTPRQRAFALGQCGVAEVFEIAFDAKLAQLSDAEFATGVLCDCLGIAHVSVGANFRFGRGRMGDVETLTRLGAGLGFTVEAVAPVQHEGRIVSSTDVRGAIEAGDVRQAELLLTRPWAVEGVVQRGFVRGRSFGFPTANLSLGDYVRPRLGIYAVCVDTGDGIMLPGVASVGLNPTVGALAEPVLEAHLLDFEGDLYGKTIEIEFAAFLRDEAKFDSHDLLKAQMRQDVVDARTALAKAADARA